ncbi:MAG: ribosomal-protein-alanine N-acetyltransferase [Flavobacteriales bacterium]|jgi:ribosomal-protein-alanine N-acetyltransferase
MNDYFNQESARLTYRALTINDVEDWKAFFVDNDSLHFVGMVDKGTVSEMAEYWIDKQLKRYIDGEYGMLGAIEKETGNVVGQVGILPRNDVSNFLEYEIGYSLKPPYWGMGYGTEMAQQMKQFGFENNVSNRFISIINKENEASIKVAKKNGMKLLFEIYYYEMEMFVYGLER